MDLGYNLGIPGQVFFFIKRKPEVKHLLPVYLSVEYFIPWGA